MSGGVGAARGGAGLLERSGQLRALGEALAAVASGGHGRIVLVAGEAGIGKTALLRRFCAGVDGSARVLWAGCVESWHFRGHFHYAAFGAGLSNWRS